MFTFALYSCSNLISISIPHSVTSIGDGAFYSCTSLTNVYYDDCKEQWGNISIGSLNSCLTNANIYVSKINLSYVIDDSNNVWKITTVNSSADATIITDIPVNNGYTFLGWATTSKATKAEYNPGDIITTGYEDITLYAVWDKKTYTTTTRTGNLFIISPTGVPNGSSIFIACYKNDVLVYTEKINYDDSVEIPLIIDEEYDKVKVFVWNSTGGMIPLTEAEDVEL
ncbi:MAG: InlB B-repeat-containing protein [Clostridia bacterium]|nr:InlB B-repeat-containing protein [Clostridia bacterium]